jgi:hypothetical protein
MESERVRLMQTTEALAALDAKRAAEAQLARACNCPPWRHAVFGLMMGALIASGAFDTAIRTAILVAILVCIPLIIRSDRKRLGMFINGYRRGKTRIVVFAILAVELSMYMIGSYYGMMLHKPLIPLLLGAAGVPIGIGGSLLWQRVFVRELTA